jgi:signal transduction histidine kinase
VGRLARTKRIDEALSPEEEYSLEEEILRRRQLEGELRDYKRKCDLLLEYLNQAIGVIQKLGNQAERTPRIEMMGKAMVAGLAHDLRNPLAVIQSCSQSCLANKKLSPADRKSLKMIQEGSQRANSLLKQFLDFIKSGLNRQPTDINELLIRAWDAARLDRKSPRVTLETRLGSDLPLMSADPEKLERVFINLFLNALRAVAPGGRVVVRSRLLALGKWIEVEVADDGPGIPTSDRNRLFEPFFSTRKEGMGLGLFLCKSFVEDHHGEISLASEEGKGTQITVRLPLVGNVPPSRTESMREDG